MHNSTLATRSVAARAHLTCAGGDMPCTGHFSPCLLVSKKEDPRPKDGCSYLSSRSKDHFICRLWYHYDLCKLDQDLHSFAALLTQHYAPSPQPTATVLLPQLLGQLHYEWGQRKHCEVLNAPYLVCSTHKYQSRSVTPTLTMLSSTSYQETLALL